VWTKKEKETAEQRKRSGVDTIHFMECVEWDFYKTHKFVQQKMCRVKFAVGGTKLRQEMPGIK
jgi:hypothetical protein